MKTYVRCSQMRKIAWIVSALICILTFAGCSRTDRMKKEIFHLVAENRETLVRDIARWDFCDTRGIEGIDSLDTPEPYVIYDCGGTGIAPSSTEVGFYYSPEDCPLGAFENTVFSTGEGFSKDGAGYSGNFGGNRYYTEKICDGFWYYEFRF